MECLYCRNGLCDWDSGKWCGCGCHHGSKTDDPNEHWRRMNTHIEQLGKSIIESQTACAVLIEIEKKLRRELLEVNLPKEWIEAMEIAKETLINIEKDYFPNVDSHKVYMAHSSMAKESLDAIRSLLGEKG